MEDVSDEGSGGERRREGKTLHVITQVQSLMAGWLGMHTCFGGQWVERERKQDYRKKR